MGDPELGVHRYLVVGYTPRVTDALLKSMAKGKQKQNGPVGTVVPANITAWDTSAPPALVVTEVLDEKPDSIRLWALIKPQNGLCTPYSVTQEVDFYRHEFRDNWPEIVKLGLLNGTLMSPSTRSSLD